MRRSSARLLTAGAALVLIGAAAAWAFAIRPGHKALAPRAEADRPALMLLTTLPLMFPEEFSLQGGGSKALGALETRYRVVAIGTTDATSLGEGRLLLMAHPLAQPAEALVDLDRWVRRGGRVLLLADPKLEWPSKRPLGDRLRPPPAFADTGLLAHWGLRLEAPEEAGPRQLKLAERDVLVASPGKLSGACALGDSALVARCRIGKGKATIIADADFLDVEQLDGPTDNNLDALLAELGALER
ncbi:MAG: hypothetical protein HOP96_02170 [Sphingomonas sp.]|nr:hypothetical protein [Sphingomonas sp.]